MEYLQIRTLKWKLYKYDILQNPYNEKPLS